MRITSTLPLVAVLFAAACSSTTTGPEAPLPSARITVTCEKTPGPTDETSARNPAGRQPPGQQPEEDLTNRECKQAGGR